VGHLFQGRYKAILCDKDVYLLELVHSIHLNPVRAEIVKAPEDYVWSGHLCYLGKGKEDLIDEGFVVVNSVTTDSWQGEGIANLWGSRFRVGIRIDIRRLEISKIPVMIPSILNTERTGEYEDIDVGKAPCRAKHYRSHFIAGGSHPLAF
jgi:hypothetical protein